MAKVQPAKFAAMESVWETQTGRRCAISCSLPDSEAERNSIEALDIPKMVSLLAFHDPNAEIKGLKDFPKDCGRPCARPS